MRIACALGFVLLLASTGCRPKSPSQQMEITADAFTATYRTLIDLSLEGLISIEDLKSAKVIKDQVRPTLAKYAEAVKGGNHPDAHFYLQELNAFFMNLKRIEAKGKNKREKKKAEKEKIRATLLEQLE